MKHNFDELSDKVCVVCSCRLKKNIVERKEKVDFCFNCYRIDQENKGNAITTAREVRKGKKRGRAKGVYAN